MPTIERLPTVELCFCLLDLPLGSLIAGIVDMVLPTVFTVYPLLARACEEDEECLWDYFFYCWLILHLFFVVGGILIIVGTCTEIQILLFVAVLIKSATIVLYLIALIFNFIVLIIADAMMLGFIFLLGGIILLSLFSYHLCVVNSWSNAMEEEQELSK